MILPKVALLLSLTSPTVSYNTQVSESYIGKSFTINSTTELAKYGVEEINGQGEFSFEVTKDATFDKNGNCDKHGEVKMIANYIESIDGKDFYIPSQVSANYGENFYSIPLNAVYDVSTIDIDAFSSVHNNDIAGRYIFPTTVKSYEEYSFRNCYADSIIFNGDIEETTDFLKGDSYTTDIIFNGQVSDNTNFLAYTTTTLVRLDFEGPVGKIDFSETGTTMGSGSKIIINNKFGDFSGYAPKSDYLIFGENCQEIICSDKPLITSGTTKVIFNGDKAPKFTGTVISPFLANKGYYTENTNKKNYYNNFFNADNLNPMGSFLDFPKEIEAKQNSTDSKDNNKIQVVVKWFSNAFPANTDFNYGLANNPSWLHLSQTDSAPYVISWDSPNKKGKFEFYVNAYAGQEKDFKLQTKIIINVAEHQINDYVSVEAGMALSLIVTVLSIVGALYFVKIYKGRKGGKK